MDWFKITRGSEPCDTDDCLNPADWRMEAGGVGSNYCFRSGYEYMGGPSGNSDRPLARSLCSVVSQFEIRPG